MAFSRHLQAFLLAVCALAFLFTGPWQSRRIQKSLGFAGAIQGKAIVCIYRVSRFTGSSSHDELYINGIHLGKLLNGEFAFMEVPPGTVVVAGLPKEYTAASSCPPALP